VVRGGGEKNAFGVPSNTDKRSELGEQMFKKKKKKKDQGRRQDTEPEVAEKVG